MLHKALADYRGEEFERSEMLCLLGDLHQLRENFATAVRFFRAALDSEKENPKVITTAYLGFSETVIRAGMTSLYDEVYDLLMEKIGDPSLRFPSQNYVICSVLAVICGHRQDPEAAQTHTLRHPSKRKIGVVKERIPWLDKLIRRK